VKTILVIALVASQTTYYEAKVTTFGCTSIDAVAHLQEVSSDEKALRAALMEKQISGECVEVLKGTQVQGSIEATDNSILRVNQEIDPPGYEAPIEDFETKQWIESSLLECRSAPAIPSLRCLPVVAAGVGFEHAGVDQVGNDPTIRS
jgi:hypothetical protein